MAAFCVSSLMVQSSGHRLNCDVQIVVLRGQFIKVEGGPQEPSGGLGQERVTGAAQDVESVLLVGEEEHSLDQPRTLGRELVRRCPTNWTCPDWRVFGDRFRHVYVRSRL